MNRFKKIFSIMLVMTNLVVSGHDMNYQKDLERQRAEQEQIQKLDQARRSTTMWAGVAGFVGAAAGVALGNWIAQSDTDRSVTVEHACVQPSRPCTCDFLSPRDLKVQAQLDCLAQYGNAFDVRYDIYNESVLVANLHKLGFTLDTINDDFFSKLADDNKKLNEIGYAVWWYGIQPLEFRKNVYLENSNELCAYFTRNKDFIRTCQIINRYTIFPQEFWNMPTIMIYPARLPEWLKAQYAHSRIMYPLLSYISRLEADRSKLMQIQLYRLSPRTILADRLQKTYVILDAAISMIYGSFEYQQEIEQQRQNELHAERCRIEEEKLELARKQIELQEQANRLAEEKNRIERERYRNGRNDRY